MLLCYTKFDGKQCPGYPYQDLNYATAHNSITLFSPVDPNVILSWTAKKTGDTTVLAILCVNIGNLGDTPRSCGDYEMSRPYFGPLTSGWPAPTYFVMGPSAAPSALGTKLYALNNVGAFGQDIERNRLFCYDAATGQSCPGSPFALNYPPAFTSKGIIGW